jgi:O-antigen ligase
MRKAAVVLGIFGVAGAGGLALAGAGAGPTLGVAAGIVALAVVVTVFRVNTEHLALFFVGLLVVTITWNGIRLGGSTTATTGVSGGAFGDLTMALAFGAVIAHVVVQKLPLPLPRWLALAGLGFFFAGLLSMVFTPSIAVMQHTVLAQANLAAQQGTLGPIGLPSNGGELLKYELALLVIPISVAAVGVTPRRCRLLVDLWALGAIVNGAVAVLDIAGIHLGPTVAVGHRSAGLTIHPNYLALTGVLALPIPMLWFARSRRWTIAGFIGLICLAGGVFASGSRAGFVAGLIALVAATVAVPRLRSNLTFVLPLAGILLVFVLVFTKTGSQILHQLRLGGSSDTSGSNYQRSLVNSAAWAQIQARPLEGVGYGVLSGAHDIYLQLLDSGGVIALVSFLVFIGGLVASVFRALSGPLRDEAIVCGIAILAWLLNGIFDNQLADKYLYLVPALLVAIGRTSWLMQTQPARPRVAIEPAVAIAPSQALVGAGAP